MSENEGKSYSIEECVDCGQRRKVGADGVCTECRQRLDMKIKKIRSRVERKGE